MRIKLTLPGQPRPLDLSQFTGNEAGEFAGCKFHPNDGIQEADAWFVFEGVDPQDDFCVVPPGQIHYLTAETSHQDQRWDSPTVLQFLVQFSHIHSCHPIDLPNVHFSPPFLPWMVNANHGSIFEPHGRDIKFFEGLLDVEKDRPLSVFSSKKTITPSHFLRKRFAEKVAKHFKGDVDWFGNGINEVPEKWDGLARYERTVVLENRSEFGVFTEKILDAFLGIAEPIYWGAPDITSYLPVKQNHQLNIRDFNGSIKTIESILRNPTKEEDKERILQGKELVLRELHFLNRIATIAKKTASALGDAAGQAYPVRLEPETLLRGEKKVGLEKLLTKLGRSRTS